MKKLTLATILISFTSLLGAPADAVSYATVTGHVLWVMQIGQNLGYVAETYAFKLDAQPTINCPSGFQEFTVSPTTIADAQTRKNMLAIIMTAKATDAQVTVEYDSSGGFCDQGRPAVYYVLVQ